MAVSVLAQKIGYLRIDNFPESLPTQSYSPHRIIRCKDELFIVKEGVVEIWHTRYDKLVKELKPGVMFGDMPPLGQTLLGTKAIAGKTGATLSVMDIRTAKKWVESNPSIYSKLGQRLYDIETEHYKSRFQLADSRLATFLLDTAGQGSTINGLTHEKIGERLGLIRETVTVILNAMKSDKLIEVQKKKITILDKRTLREMSEL
ncbi:MAG TPA: Crp/Fnr family transcriptional regulator [Blastocatellia bacterium]|nr:Crp/Fnr family transcriptional regulator [Blastocatellia bacterium]